MQQRSKHNTRSRMETGTQKSAEFLSAKDRQQILDQSMSLEPKTALLMQPISDNKYSHTLRFTIL